MSYFQLYEKKRNLYKKIQPGSVWINETGNNTIIISSVNSSRGTINGTWNSITLRNSITLSGNDTINWLLRHYHRVEE